MALSDFLPTTPSSTHHNRILEHNHHGRGQHEKQLQQNKVQQRKRKKQPPPPLPPPPLATPKAPSSWEQFKNLLTCRSIGPSQVHDPSAAAATTTNPSKYTKLPSSCTSICAFKDVAQSNTRVVHRGGGDHHRHDSYSGGSDPPGPETGLLAPATPRSVRSSAGRSGYFHHSSRGGGGGGGLQLRKLSGCYECRAITEPRRYPMPRTISACPDCGEVFTKPDSLEHHQAVRHAVSELGTEDSGRHIVEIIFKSSWLKKEQPICKIERILKVHNTQRTISRFEDYRAAVKSRANAAAAALLLQHHPTAAAAAKPGKKNPRCAADGNELLRFHCTTLSCNLGARGSTGLCSSSSSAAAAAAGGGAAVPLPAPPCGVCTIIRHGFGRAHHEHGKGVGTTASSGRAHDCLGGGGDGDGGGRRAMLVCRVIAGRVRRLGEETASPEAEGASPAGYDSVAGPSAGGGGVNGAFTNLEELFVSNPRAILPCFVVIYRAMG